MGGFRVYVGKPVENKRLRRKILDSGGLSGNRAASARKNLENKEAAEPSHFFAEECTKRGGRGRICEETIPCAFGATKSTVPESTPRPGLSGGCPVWRSASVRRLSEHLAVRFAAIADGGNVDGVLAPLIEEHAVVAAAEPEAGERRFEFLHIAGAVSQVAIHAVENLHCGFAVDGAHIGAGLGRPDDGDPFRRRWFGHLSRPNSRMMSS